jgi:hypothetical protein
MVTAWRQESEFGRTAELNTDWISQLRRVLDVTDNQVRALSAVEISLIA